MAKDKKGVILSRLDYPETVKYKGESLVVSPRAKLQIKYYDLLDVEHLPKGITARPID